MSAKYQPQIWGKNPSKINNRDLSNELAVMLKNHYPNKTSVYIASDLRISPKRVDNWLFAGTGMTALDLLFLIRRYDFIREWALAEKLAPTRKKGKEKVKETYKKVMDILQKNSKMTMFEMQNRLLLSKRQVERALDELKRRGRIERRGSTKSGRWVIKEKNEAMEAEPENTHNL